MDSVTECSGRQDADLDALRAMYPEDGAVTLDIPASNAEAVREAFQNHSGTVRLPGVQLHGRSVGIGFQLPRSYPEQTPDVHVICEAGTWSCFQSIVYLTTKECCKTTERGQSP